MAHAMYIINNMVQMAVIIFFVNNLLKPKLKFILIELLIIVNDKMIWILNIKVNRCNYECLYVKSEN